MAERTFIAIKPAGVQRGLVSEILGRFERKGFKLVGLKQITPTRALAEQHYGVHKERPFFAGLVDFMNGSAAMVDAFQRKMSHVEDGFAHNREALRAKFVERFAPKKIFERAGIDKLLHTLNQ